MSCGVVHVVGGVLVGGGGSGETLLFWNPWDVGFFSHFIIIVMRCYGAIFSIVTQIIITNLL